MKRLYFWITKICPYCKWPFQCPTGPQEARIACRACESRR